MNFFLSFRLLIGFSVFILFAIQWVAAASEKSGVVSCTQECQEEESHTDSPCSTPHCETHCPCHFLSSIVESPVFLIEAFADSHLTYADFSQIPPEEPFLGIDYPPLILS